MFAVWYLFDKDDENYLSKLISNLAQKYNSFSFVPHITAYGLVDIELKILDKEISKIIQGINSFSINATTANFSNNFWKSFFIEVSPNSNFTKINNNLAKKLSQFSKYDFIPHISLLYKHMTKNQKQFLVENLQIKNFFKIKGLGILSKY